jgi:hypothetical protein
VCKLYALQGAADNQNEITEKQNTHRPVNILEFSAEVVILLKVKCEEISYMKKIIAWFLTTNTREIKYIISSGTHLFQALYFGRDVWMESTSVIFRGVHKIDKSDY